MYWLGLMHEDTLKECPEVKEALRRLPRDVADERQYRISRALYLSMRHEILPKEEWTTYDTVWHFLSVFTLMNHRVHCSTTLLTATS